MSFISVMVAAAVVKGQALLAVLAVQGQAALAAASAFVLSPLFPLFLYLAVFAVVMGAIAYYDYKEAKHAAAVLAQMEVTAAEMAANKAQAKQEDVAALAKADILLTEQLSAEQVKVNTLQEKLEAATLSVTVAQQQADAQIQAKGQVSLPTQLALAKAQVEVLKINHNLIYARYEISEMAVEKAGIACNFNVTNPLLSQAIAQFEDN